MLEIKNISKSYGAQRVLNSICQEFGAGRIVGLLGPNGAGKSTLMKIVTGYIAADEGEVFIDGKRVEVDDVETKQLVGYLPEHNPLYLDMYVREYLDFVAFKDALLPYAIDGAFCVIEIDGVPANRYGT